MKQRLSRLILLPATLAIPLALAGCDSKQERSRDRSPSLPTAQVRVQTVERKKRILTEEVVATVRAKLRATLEAKLSGRIEAMPVALGESVRKGQLIARLEGGEIGARLEQAEASLEQSERDWKRVSSLFEQGSAARAELDSAQARLRIAKGAAAEARAMMAYVQILAPFDGLITSKRADVGDLAAPGKPLVDLEDPSALQLVADVPEAVASHIVEKSRLDARVDAAHRVVTGIVREIAPTADPVSRTVQVKLDLPQSDGLKPGQFARLAVPIGEIESIRVPAEALVSRGQLEIVFTLTNRHARLHLVRTGRRVGDEIEILSGLDPGETVISGDVEQLTDGQPAEAR